MPVKVHVRPLQGGGAGYGSLVAGEEELRIADFGALTRSASYNVVIGESRPRSTTGSHGWICTAGSSRTVVPRTISRPTGAARPSERRSR
jgi:hypothetical protein